ncbi:unnamed protein product [Gadus morhua 'NCC']
MENGKASRDTVEVSLRTTCRLTRNSHVTPADAVTFASLEPAQAIKSLSGRTAPDVLLVHCDGNDLGHLMGVEHRTGLISFRHAQPGAQKHPEFLWTGDTGSVYSRRCKPHATTYSKNHTGPKERARRASSWEPERREAAWRDDAASEFGVSPGLGVRPDDVQAEFEGIFLRPDSFVRPGSSSSGTWRSADLVTRSLGRRTVWNRIR